jgi:hypothetical protein
VVEITGLGQGFKEAERQQDGEAGGTDIDVHGGLKGLARFRQLSSRGFRYLETVRKVLYTEV